MKKQFKKWELVKSEPISNLKLFKARFDYFKNPRNGITEKMIVLESEDSANVVASTVENEILFVKQFRFGTQQYTLELPGGMVDRGEDHEKAVRRELLEETGCKAENWSYLGKIGSNPVFMNSHVHHWMAENVEKIQRQVLDAGEDIEILKIPLSKVRDQLLSGRFSHPHTISALLLFFAKSEQL